MVGPVRRRRPGELNLQQMRAYRPHWPWERLEGSAAVVKWSFRDLANLDVAIGLTGRRRTCAVQAGGNIGLFPKRLAEEFHTVIAFEPDPGLYQTMRRNAPEGNILTYQMALGETREGVSMRTARRDNSGRGVHEGLTHVAGGGLIRQVRLDDLKLKACDLLYLDIEGYELRALRGAVRTIDKHRPVIGVEINRNIEHYGATAEELRAWLEQAGYVRRHAMNSDEIFVPRE